MKNTGNPMNEPQPQKEGYPERELNPGRKRESEPFGHPNRQGEEQPGEPNK